jgi:hypothetical protein
MGMHRDRSAHVRRHRKNHTREQSLMQFRRGSEMSFAWTFDLKFEF